MRRLLIAGNWKMFKTREEANNLVMTLKAGVRNLEGEVDVVICPPFTALATAGQALAKTQIELGAQNMHFGSEGAFTGEISPLMLKDLGVRYVVLGHSERRSLFSESDQLVNQKIKTALKYNLVPIACVGEWLEQRDAGRHFDVVRGQCEETFAEISRSEIDKVVVAYEPVWAIGTGRTATPEQAQEMHQFIRRWFTDKYGEGIGSKLRILYGGSVKPDNITELAAEPDVDGALVGGASLKAESFLEIIQGSLQVPK